MRVYKVTLFFDKEIFPEKNFSAKGLFPQMRGYKVTLFFDPKLFSTFEKISAKSLLDGVKDPIFVRKLGPRGCKVSA